MISDNPEMSSYQATAHTDWIDQAEDAGLHDFMDIMLYEGREDGLNTREPSTLPVDSARALNKTYKVGGSAVMSPARVIGNVSFPASVIRPAKASSLEEGVTLYKGVTVSDLKSDSASGDVVVGDIVTDEKNELAFNLGLFRELLNAVSYLNPGRTLSFGYRPSPGDQPRCPLLGTTMQLGHLQSAPVHGAGEYEDDYGQEADGDTTLVIGSESSEKTVKTLQDTFYSALGFGGVFVVSDIVVGALMAAKVINFSQLNMAAQGGSVAAMVALPVLCIAIAVICLMVANNRHNKRTAYAASAPSSAGKVGAHFASVTTTATTYPHGKGASGVVSMAEGIEYSPVAQEEQEEQEKQEGGECDNAGGGTALGGDASLDDDEWLDSSLLQMQSVQPVLGQNNQGASTSRVVSGIWQRLSTDALNKHTNGVENALGSDDDVRTLDTITSSDDDRGLEPNPFA